MKKRVVGKPVLAEIYKTKFLPEDLTCELRKRMENNSNRKDRLAFGVLVANKKEKKMNNGNLGSVKWANPCDLYETLPDYTCDRSERHQGPAGACVWL